LRVVIGGQRHEFCTALVEFRELFCTLRTELLSNVLALVARLLFAVFELLAHRLQLCLLLVQLLAALIQLSELLPLGRLLVSQFDLLALELASEFLELAAFGGESCCCRSSSLRSCACCSCFVAQLFQLRGQFRAVLVEDAACSACWRVLRRVLPARVQLRGPLLEFLLGQPPLPPAAANPASADRIRAGPR